MVFWVKIPCILVGGTNLLPPSQPSLRPRGAIDPEHHILYFHNFRILISSNPESLKKIKRLCQQDAVAQVHRNFQLTLYKPIKVYIAYRTVVTYDFHMKIVPQWKHTVLTVCT